METLVMRFAILPGPGGIARSLAAALCVAMCGNPAPGPAMPAGSAREALEVAAGGDGSGIGITFDLARSGYVTLVIETDGGTRIANVISERWFEAGRHRIEWDGYGVGTGQNYRRNGMGTQYDVVRPLVSAGTYRVRGIVHDAIELEFVASLYSSGSPPWMTPDSSGAWLSDHAPPVDVEFLPFGSAVDKRARLAIAAEIAESGHSYAWLTAEGQKVFGYREGWNGALALASPSSRDDARHLYSLTQTDKSWLIRGHQGKKPPQVLFRGEGMLADSLTLPDLLIHGEVAAVSVPSADKLLFVSVGFRARRNSVIAEFPVGRPSGLALAGDGGLWVLASDRVERYSVDWSTGTVRRTGGFRHGLSAPQRILEVEGKLLVSDRETHQVVRFNPDGTPAGRIGVPGGAVSGPYDEHRMDSPTGMAWDGESLWVAEASGIVRRVSRWTADGKFVAAYYGSPKYGGGGALDPTDERLVYYAHLEDKRRSRSGIAFRIDPTTGTSRPEFVYLSPNDPGDWSSLPSAGPEQPVRREGRTYLTNSFNRTPAGQTPIAGIWLLDANRRARLVAAVGSISSKGSRQWPALERAVGAVVRNRFFAWSDLDLDGRVDASEVTVGPTADDAPRVYVHSDLSVWTSSGQHVPAPSVRADGVPIFDISTVGPAGTPSDRSDGDVLATSDGWQIRAGGPLEGHGPENRAWSYDNQWFGRGQVSGLSADGVLSQTSRIAGYSFPVAGRVLWALANDVGSVYLFSSDGLYVTQIGGDYRNKPGLGAVAVSGSRIPAQSFSFNWETFWPTVSRSGSDGGIYVVAGKEHSSVFRIHGLESITDLDAGTLSIGSDQLAGLPRQRLERSEDRIAPH